jgi:hypothetical protein
MPDRRYVLLVYNEKKELHWVEKHGKFMCGPVHQINSRHNCSVTVVFLLITYNYFQGLKGTLVHVVP